MARSKDTPQAPATMPEILPAKATELMVAQDAALSVSEIDQVFASGKDIGRLEALDFVATVANSAILPIYENVKKSKAWQFLRNPKSSNGSNFESLDEFCEVKLGKSYGRMQHLVANRNLIGLDAFEQAERLGLRQVDYNAIKTLPAPDQELVRRAVEDAKSRDEVLDLLQELAARHAKEKTTLQADLEDARADKEASDKLMADKNAKIDKLSRHIKKLTPDQKLLELQREATGISHDAMGCVRGQLRQALIALKNHGDDDVSVFMAGLVGQVQADLTALRDEFNLPDVSSVKDQELAAQVAQWAPKKAGV